MVLVQTDKACFELIVTDKRDEVVAMDATSFCKLFYYAYAWPVL
jgi:hypothetical protein